MSRHDYLVSQLLARRDDPFRSLVMAAMRRADSDNWDRLRAAFPDIAEELLARYNAPDGVLPGETS